MRDFLDTDRYPRYTDVNRIVHNSEQQSNQNHINKQKETQARGALAETGFPDMIVRPCRVDADDMDGVFLTLTT